jgi:hypothetical protein
MAHFACANFANLQYRAMKKELCPPFPPEAQQKWFTNWTADKEWWNTRWHCSKSSGCGHSSLPDFAHWHPFQAAQSLLQNPLNLLRKQEKIWYAIF